MRVQSAFRVNAMRFVALFRFEYLLALLLGLNLLDCVTTSQALSMRAVEINPFVLAMGGPFASLPLFMKLVLIPGLAVILIPLFYRSEHKHLMRGMLVPAIAFYVFVIAHQAWVILVMSSVCPV